MTGIFNTGIAPKITAPATQVSQPSQPYAAPQYTYTPKQFAYQPITGPVSVAKPQGNITGPAYMPRPIQGYQSEGNTMKEAT